MRMSLPAEITPPTAVSVRDSATTLSPARVSFWLPMNGPIIAETVVQFFAVDEEEQSEKLRRLETDLRGEVERALPASSRPRGAGSPN